MTHDQAEALGLDVRRDGDGAFVVTYRGALEAWIEKSSRDATLWRALNVRGKLFHGRSVSTLLDQIADHLPPRA